MGKRKENLLIPVMERLKSSCLTMGKVNIGDELSKMVKDGLIEGLSRSNKGLWFQRIKDAAQEWGLYVSVEEGKTAKGWTRKMTYVRLVEDDDLPGW